MVLYIVTKNKVVDYKMIISEIVDTLRVIQITTKLFDNFFFKTIFDFFIDLFKI